MIRCTMRAVARPPAAMDYAFYDEGGLKILHNRDNALTDQFDYLFRELPIIPYTLSLIDADGNEGFSLKKKTVVTQTVPAFTLYFPEGSVDFLEDKERFSLPNISFRFHGECYDITGFVRARTFYIKRGEEILASYSGRRTAEGKEYDIAVESGELPLAVYLATAIVLDIYFHNY